MRCARVLIFYLFCITALNGQDYPKGDFIFPINPGKQNYLSGTFGELRSGHFHSGIDIKTGGREGADVHAVANGYVSRIKVSTGGYGKALYIDHPNGYTTVYAHLQKFNKFIDSIIKKEQYRKESFEINYFPQKNSIPVQQNEIIAYSGNTGGSMGPHLHFEIRNNKQEPINPFYFGFTEVQDDIVPTVRNISFSPIEYNSRINGRFDDVNYLIKGNQFNQKDTVFVQGKFHLNIDAIDKLNGVSNKNGIARIEAKIDGETFYDMVVDQFSFGNTRMINEHINYRLYKDRGIRYYKLKFNPINRLTFYKALKNDGELEINDNGSHLIVITVDDFFGNQSVIKIPIRKTENMIFPKKEPSLPKYKVIGETMKITIPSRKEIPITVKGLKKQKIINPSYQTKKSIVYLIDLKSIVPREIFLDSTLFRFPFIHFIEPNKSYNLNYGKWNVSFPRGAFYNSFLLTIDTTNNGFTIGDNHEPFYKKFTISSPRQTSNDKLGSYTEYGKKKYDFEKSFWKDNIFMTSSRDLGTFRFIVDSIPPSIKEIVISTNEISLEIRDNLSGIDKIDAYLNKQWLLMNYDYKTNKIWAEGLDSNIPFRGDLSIKISDNQGNIANFAKKIP